MKSQININYMAGAVILVFFLAFMLAVVMPKFIKWWTPATEEAGCTISIWMDAMRQYLSLGTLSLPPQCKSKNVIVDDDLFSEYKAKAKSEIARYKAYDYSRILSQFDNPKDDKRVNELALDLLIGDELVSCSKKVLRGKLPMFDQNYNILDLTLFGAFEGDYSEREAKLIEKFNLGFIELWGAPKACIVCSHIRFDETIQKLDLPESIQTLNPVLEHTPGPKGYAKSAYEYLEEVQLYVPFNHFSLKTKHWAVVYLRENKHLLTRVIDFIGMKNIETFLDYFLLVNPMTAPSYTINKIIQPNLITQSDLQDNLQDQEIAIEDINLFFLVPFNDVQKPVKDGGLGCLTVVQ